MFIICLAIMKGPLIIQREGGFLNVENRKDLKYYLNMEMYIKME